MPGAFAGTASSTTSQMEKMLRAFSPIYEACGLNPGDQKTSKELKCFFATGTMRNGIADHGGNAARARSHGYDQNGDPQSSVRDFPY
jgi:hypothetical protein